MNDDQRADTPRTPDDALAEYTYYSEQFGHAFREGWAAAKAAADSLPSVGPAAACDLDPDGHCNTHGGRHIEPAAAEPPDLTWCDCRHTADDHTDRGNQDAGLCLYPSCGCREFVEWEGDERAAQPPRGSLPDRAVPFGTTRYITNEPAGGSLTATAQATPSEEPPDGG